MTNGSRQGKRMKPLNICTIWFYALAAMGCFSVAVVLIWQGVVQPLRTLYTLDPSIFWRCVWSWVNPLLCMVMLWSGGACVVLACHQPDD